MILEPELLPEIESNAGPIRPFVRSMIAFVIPTQVAVFLCGSFENIAQSPCEGVDLSGGRKGEIAQGQATHSLKMRGGFSDQVFDIWRGMLRLGLGCA